MFCMAYNVLQVGFLLAFVVLSGAMLPSSQPHWSTSCYLNRVKLFLSWGLHLYCSFYFDCLFLCSFMAGSWADIPLVITFSWWLSLLPLFTQTCSLGGVGRLFFAHGTFSQFVIVCLFVSLSVLCISH